VADTAPAIFTLDGSGVNQNYTVNSPYLPAVKGSAITLFATGAGQADPPGVDGQIAGDILPKLLPLVTVQIGVLDAIVMNAGAAAGLVASVPQVNCLVPKNSPSGYGCRSCSTSENPGVRRALCWQYSDPESGKVFDHSSRWRVSVLPGFR